MKQNSNYQTDTQANETTGNTGTDASDGSPEALGEMPAANGTVVTEEVDPNIEEFGPLLAFDEDGNIKLNHIAIAANLTRDRQICFDLQAEQFRKYGPVTGVWQALTDAKAKLLLGAFLKEIAVELDAPALLMMRTSSLLGAILSLARGHALMGEPDASSGPVIHCANGMLDFTEAKPVLREFHADYWSKTACAIPYNPQAKCERFKDELLKPALSGENISLLQRYLGAVLMGLNAAQRFLVLYGEAASGKSTLVKLLERIIGLALVATLRTIHLSGRFETHGFQGKILLTAKDVASDFLAHSAAKAIKGLIGDDAFETEKKYGGKSQLVGNRNVLVTSNARLRLSLDEDEAAWRRRLLVIHFKRAEGTKRVTNFADVLLKEESEGIFAWIVEGAVKHLEELKDHGDFKLTQGQQDQVESWILESRSVEEFVGSSVVKKDKANVSVDELLAGYFHYCREKQWSPVSAREFTVELGDLMIRLHGVHKRNDIVRGGKAVRGFQGVALSSK
jgi:P4 family phage/plasmid primase-like protien